MTTPTAEAASDAEGVFYLPREFQEHIVLGCALVSIVFGLYNVWKIMQVEVKSSKFALGDMEMRAPSERASMAEVETQMVKISKLIQEGATTFLK
jgi:hypothetical protein